jgi:hypothetical protein
VKASGGAFGCIEVTAESFCHFEGATLDKPFGLRLSPMA